jgi:hypothetical protein
MPTTSVEFQSAFGLAESVDRLKAATRRSVFASMARQAAVGRVSAKRVALQRVIPMFGNSFKPFFVGSFIERDGRIFLVGEFRMFWLVRAFMIFWFGMIALMALLSATVVPASSHNRWFSFLGAIVMASAGLALVTFGKWLSRNDPAWISGVIEGALSAERAPTPPQRSADSSRMRLIGVVCLVLAVLSWLPLFTAGGSPAVQGSATGPSHLPSALSAIDGAVLAFIAYGAFRRELFAWRLGFIFLCLAWLQATLQPIRDRAQFKFPMWGEIAFILASILVTVMWGWWWYAQREYWQPEGDRDHAAYS